jgi:hypothetical protein
LEQYLVEKEAKCVAKRRKGSPIVSEKCKTMLSRGYVRVDADDLGKSSKKAVNQEEYLG